jgi:hypothetical protein
MMFCRYCGSQVAADSVFCSKCGKNLGLGPNPRLTKIVDKLRLKTPYPYFALLLIAFIAWAVSPRQSHADYSKVTWSIQLDRKLDLSEENLFQQSLSLVLENGGESTIRDIPIELSAKIEPSKPADIEAGFLGRKLMIMQKGQQLPLIIVLADPIEPRAKRRYLLEGKIQAQPPFKVTYEVREEGRAPVLASYVVEP